MAYLTQRISSELLEAADQSSPGKGRIETWFAKYLVDMLQRIQNYMPKTENTSESGRQGSLSDRAHAVIMDIRNYVDNPGDYYSRTRKLQGHIVEVYLGPALPQTWSPEVDEVLTKKLNTGQDGLRTAVLAISGANLSNPGFDPIFSGHRLWIDGYELKDPAMISTDRMVEFFLTKPEIEMTLRRKVPDRAMFRVDLAPDLGDNFLSIGWIWNWLVTHTTTVEFPVEMPKEWTSETMDTASSGTHASSLADAPFQSDGSFGSE